LELNLEDDEKLVFENAIKNLEECRKTPNVVDMDPTKTIFYLEDDNISDLSVQKRTALQDLQALHNAQKKNTAVFNCNPIAGDEHEDDDDDRPIASLMNRHKRSAVTMPNNDDDIRRKYQNQMASWKQGPGTECVYGDGGRLPRQKGPNADRLTAIEDGMNMLSLVKERECVKMGCARCNKRLYAI
jgi:hypothetical protein